MSVDTPVQVTVEEPKTAKLAAVPGDGADCARTRLPTLNTHIVNISFFISKVLGWISVQRRGQEGEQRCRVDFEIPNRGGC